MIVVTGGAGFIGSNLVKALNARGERDILVVDDLSDGSKFRNLADCDIADYQDKDDFLARLARGGRAGSWRAVFHNGACSDTMEWDGRFMMRNNYDYSKALLHACLNNSTPFIYASSASVYGAGPEFREAPACERPLNVYGYSKLQFDNYVRRRAAKADSQVVGLRYFNVYGPRETHKARMASVVFHCDGQIRETGEAKLFVGCDGYGDGEQRRDFVYVGDVAAVNLWLLDHPQCSGIFNLGTGNSHSFNELANAVIAWHGKGKINYVEFPESLRGRYQSFTEADMSALRAAGCDHAFLDIRAGVKAYLDTVASGG